MEKIRIRNKHPGSVTLYISIPSCVQWRTGEDKQWRAAAYAHWGKHLRLPRPGLSASWGQGGPSHLDLISRRPVSCAASFLLQEARKAPRPRIEEVCLVQSLTFSTRGQRGSSSRPRIEEVYLVRRLTFSTRGQESLISQPHGAETWSLFNMPTSLSERQL